MNTFQKIDYSNSDNIFLLVCAVFVLLFWIALETVLLTSSWWWQWKLVLSVIFTFVATLVIGSSLNNIKLKER